MNRRNYFPKIFKTFGCHIPGLNVSSRHTLRNFSRAILKVRTRGQSPRDQKRRTVNRSLPRFQRERDINKFLRFRNKTRVKGTEGGRRKGTDGGRRTQDKRGQVFPRAVNSCKLGGTYLFISIHANGTHYPSSLAGS